jgi:hypothetical protein
MTNQSGSSTLDAIAKESFRFLVDAYGYLPHNTKNDSVEFVKDDLVVEVFQESGSFMIYIEIGRRSTGESYLLHEILKALVPEKHLKAQCSGNGAIKMRHCLNHLSQLCQQHLHDILSSDALTWQKVEESAKIDRNRYTLECQYGAIKDRANRAWDRKEWDLARRLYEESKPILSNTELKRLDMLVRGKLDTRH